MDENLNQDPQNEIVEEAPRSFPIKKVISLVVGLIVILIIILIVVFVVIPRISPKKQENVTLKYWLAWEDPAPYKAIADEFTRKNPHIKVEVEKQDIKNLGKYIDRLKKRSDIGTGPDLYRFHNAWVTELIGLSLILPLPQDVVSATELDSKFYPVVKNDLQVNGAYYGVPLQFDTLALFVNTQIFKENGIETYPSTWEDLYPLALKLTVADENGKITTSGIALGTYDNVSHAPDIVSLLLTQSGANPRKLNGEQQSSTDAFVFYTSFVNREGAVWDSTMENSTLAFAKGNVAMFLGYSWNIFEIKAINPELQFAILPAPYVAGGQPSTIASYWVEGVSSKSKHPAEAFEFLKFLGSRQNMEKLYAQEAKTRLFGELYPRTDMADLLKSNTLIYPFVSQGKNAVSTIFSSNTYDDAMVDQLNTYMGDAIRAITNDGTSPQTAVDTLSQGVAEVIGKYAK